MVCRASQNEAGGIHQKTMSATAKRLAKIEIALELCEWCKFTVAQDKAFYAALRAQGIQPYQSKPGESFGERCSQCGRQINLVSMPELQAELAALDALAETMQKEGRRPYREDWQVFVTHLENVFDFHRRIYGAEVFNKAFAETAWPDYLHRSREDMAKAPSREEPTP